MLKRVKNDRNDPRIVGITLYQLMKFVDCLAKKYHPYVSYR
jgi:hypothetical protein